MPAEPAPVRPAESAAESVARAQQAPVAPQQAEPTPPTSQTPPAMAPPVTPPEPAAQTGPAATPATTMQTGPSPAAPAEPVAQAAEAPAQPAAPKPATASLANPAPPRTARRAPVVATPDTAGIHVVQSDPGSQRSLPLGRGLGANPQTMPIDMVRAAQAGDDEAEVTEEVWPDDSPEARALGKPMKAADVTHQDGEILMGERFSATPFIALGVAFIVAVVLIVVALTMLF